MLFRVRERVTFFRSRVRERYVYTCVCGGWQLVGVIKFWGFLAGGGGMRVLLGSDVRVIQWDISNCDVRGR